MPVSLFGYLEKTKYIKYNKNINGEGDIKLKTVHIIDILREKQQRYTLPYSSK